MITVNIIALIKAIGVTVSIVLALAFFEVIMEAAVDWLSEHKDYVNVVLLTIITGGIFYIIYNHFK